jgi:predicted house-cleaning noncanonical NTP pyrophosphatase (MazG superfamily)
MKALSVGANAKNANIGGIHWRCLNVNKQQIQWIYNHVENITIKYLNLFPLSDELWQQLLEEVKEVHKMSRENETVAELLFVVLNYFDKLDVIYRREAENG